MLMHSCRCILFVVVTGFYLFAKMFKNHFEIGFGKSNLEKEEILSSLSPSNSACRPDQPSRFFFPHSPFLFPGPAHHRQVTTSTLLYSSVSLTHRARLSAPSPTSVVQTRTHGDATTAAPTFSHRGSLCPCPGLYNWEPDPVATPCCSFLLARSSSPHCNPSRACRRRCRSHSHRPPLHRRIE
jgi:hypothetical protein